MSITDSRLLEVARQVITTESQMITDIAARMDQNFCAACRYILQCTGKVIVIGIGKSGHIARKIAATMASTGTPAFFVHPSEAGHGDLGMIEPQDVLLLLSNSGETDEIITLLPMLKQLQNTLIAIVGDMQSTLARAATVNIDASISAEACPMDLAPTSSTTVALVIGDAIAIALLEARGFGADDFARAHPSGTLGRRLLLTVQDIMHSNDEMPCVHADDKLRDALVEMTKKCLGMTAIIDDKYHVQGIFTDGDVRRALDVSADPKQIRIGDIMTADCKTIQTNMLAIDALNLMQQHKINALLVTDAHNTLLGVVNMHDLLQARIQ